MFMVLNKLKKCLKKKSHLSTHFNCSTPPSSDTECCTKRYYSWTHRRHCFPSRSLGPKWPGRLNVHMLMCPNKSQINRTYLTVINGSRLSLVPMGTIPSFYLKNVLQCFILAELFSQDRHNFSPQFLTFISCHIYCSV